MSEFPNKFFCFRRGFKLTTQHCYMAPELKHPSIAKGFD